MACRYRGRFATETRAVQTLVTGGGVVTGAQLRAL